MARGFDWARHLDGVARAALRRLVPASSIVAPVAEWGRCDGADGSPVVAFVSSHPAHLPIVMDELKAALPSVQFVVDNPAPLMRAHLLDARPLWGDGALPAAPIGDTFAFEWAPVQLVARASMRGTPAQLGLADWHTLRAICAIGCVDLPGAFEWPAWVQDLYVARNMGLDQLPDTLHVFADALAHRVAADLRHVVAGTPVGQVAAALRSWLD